MIKKDLKYNRTIYYRAKHDKDNPYTPISNTIVKDKRLSFLEKGLILFLLSNSDEYRINKSVILTQSGHGRKAIDNAFKHLKEIGYIGYMYKNNIHTWIINECPEYYHDSNSTKEITQKYDNSSDITKVSSILEQVINTNEIVPNENNTNKKINNEEINNEKQTLGFKDSPRENEEEKTLSYLDSRESEITHPNNDLNLILLNSDKFNKIYYQSGNGWEELDISKYSNSSIAHYVIEKEKGNVESNINSLVYNLFCFMVKYSSTIEGANLWKEFKRQCESEYLHEFVPRYDYNHD